MRIVVSQVQRQTPENKAKAERTCGDPITMSKVTALAEHKSISRETAEKLIPKQTAVERDRREYFLHPNDIIEIQDKKLPVSELLERGEEFDNVAMPDPIEGRDYGPSTAKFYYNDGMNPVFTPLLTA